MSNVEMEREAMAHLMRSIDEPPRNPFPPVAIAETPRWCELISNNQLAKQGAPPLQPAEVFELADLNDRARVSGAEQNRK